MNQSPPNIILIHWHDLGRFLGCYGRKGVKTPNIDRLAQRGYLFENARCTSPLCSPARGSLFTGLHPHVNGLLGLTYTAENYRYRPGVKTLPSYLREAGYHAFLFGQQHEGRTELLGFEEACIPTPLCRMKSVTTLASDFLRHRAPNEAPFFASIGFFEPHRHGPTYPAELYGSGETEHVPTFLKDHPEVRRDLFGFYEAVRQADEHTGKILQALEDSGLSENTLVIFTSDHGIAFPRAKSTLYDAGLEIPLIMALPGNIPDGRRSPTPVSGIDLVPTILEAANIEIPSTLPGVSHWKEITDNAPPQIRPIFAERSFHDGYNPMRAVAHDNFKLIQNFQPLTGMGVASDIRNSPSMKAYHEELHSPRPEIELYDLQADPDEQHNIAGDPIFAEKERELQTLLNEWMRDTGDFLPARADNPPMGDEWCNTSIEEAATAIT